MFGDFQALHQAESAAEVEGLAQIMWVKALRRKQQPPAIDIRAVDAGQIVHPVAVPDRQPRALAAADVEHGIRRQLLLQQRHDAFPGGGGARIAVLEEALVVGWHRPGALRQLFYSRAVVEHDRGRDQHRIDRLAVAALDDAVALRGGPPGSQYINDYGVNNLWHPATGPYLAASISGYFGAASSAF